MKLNELKTAVRQHMTDDQVRQYGKLTLKSTWEAALASIEVVANTTNQPEPQPQSYTRWEQLVYTVVYVVMSFYKAFFTLADAAFYWGQYARAQYERHIVPKVSQVLAQVRTVPLESMLRTICPFN